jgi:uncharacterized protein YdaL
MFRGLVARAFAAAFTVLFIAACSSSTRSLPTTGESSLQDATHTSSVLESSSKKHHKHRERSDRFVGLAGRGIADLPSAVAYALASDRSRRNGHGNSDGRSESLDSGFRGVSALRPASVAPLGSAKTLVLYDTSGTWGFLGELYAMAAGNLAGHFGPVTYEPIGSYKAGQLAQYTAGIYIGSTYYSLGADGIPAAFYSDVASGVKPVIWAGYNIWNMGDTIGPATFDAKYGWDPTNSYFTNAQGTVGAVTSVTYKTASLTRTFPAGTDGGVLHDDILGGTYPAVTTLATAVDTSTTPSSTFPWAISSGNLTYIGEIPFQYVNESDRVIAFEDILFNDLAPTTATRHRAMVRLEDLNASDDPTQDLAMAQWLYANKIPFGFGVIPVYTDPLGYYNGGVPQTLTLTQSPQVLSAIQYMVTHGGTEIDHGYTHQYDAVDNPYDGVTADDAEFFRATINSGNYVVWDNPVTEDSASWTQSRITNALAGFVAAGLPKPTIWEFPHYAASAIDYQTVAASYAERYERSFYFNGLVAGGTISGTSFLGEFYPYVVVDSYGTKVLPENLGDYEPTAQNNNPPRTAAEIVSEAQLNTVVRDGFASFFIHPYDGTTVLQQIVTGIKAAGYTFVAPSSL